MIPIRELATNNKVLFEGKQVVIKYIDAIRVQVGFFYNISHVYVNPNRVDPIPLTEEILVELVFVKQGRKRIYAKVIGDYVIFINLINEIPLVFYIDNERVNSKVNEIQYLHQLQNWYFFSFNQEL